MFIVGILSWWYGAGWRARLVSLTGRMDSISDYFSIGLLAKTLFSPFRQISAGSVRGSLSIQMRAIFDNLISRFIGAGVRIVVMIVGLLTLLFSGIIGLLFVLLWAVVPFLPIIGIILFCIGWKPWHL